MAGSCFASRACGLLDRDSLTDLEQRFGKGIVRIGNALVATYAVRELRRRGGADDGDEGSAARGAALDEWLPVPRRQVQAVREAPAQR